MVVPIRMWPSFAHKENQVDELDPNPSEPATVYTSRVLMIKSQAAFCLMKEQISSLQEELIMLREVVRKIHESQVQRKQLVKRRSLESYLRQWKRYKSQEQQEQLLLRLT